ncbi:hypothetical protein P7C70_g2313, partial [Phenoliferia sp. Uapishka_3]
MSGPFPARSTSLNRSEARRQQTHEMTDYPPTLQHEYHDSDPLNSTQHTAGAEDFAQRPTGGTPRATAKGGILPYTSNSPSSGNSPNDSSFGDQPYYGRGSLDLSDAYGGTDHLTGGGHGGHGGGEARTRNDSMDTSTSRVPIYTPTPFPIHLGASVQMSQQDPTRGRDTSTADKRYSSGRGEKSGYKSPPTHSRDSSHSRAGLGNWQGPAGGASPYGPLGSGPPHGVGSPLVGQSGMNTPSASNPNLLFAEDEDRIDEQKFQIKVLTALYLNSHDTNHRDTILVQPGARPKNRRQLSDPTLLVKKALHVTKKVVQSTTTVIGTVASEIAGERVLQPNAPASIVMNALGSANKSKALARRIYYSFVPAYRKEVLLEDVSKCFQNREIADRAFSVFDRDGNGDISLEELEMACLEIHRERLALSNSMRDIDSAVGRIIMSVWYVVAIIIIIGLLDASFQTMITGWAYSPFNNLFYRAKLTPVLLSAGTVILGLSWLIGTTAQEILASVIFLFVKHVYDVGDRVDIDGVGYVVKEMQLLSTIFRRTDGVIVQAPHSVLNTKFVNNIRRSGAISEKFTWDVDFSTPLEKIEALRARMLEFLEVERRDFLPQIDIAVQDFDGQGKLELSAEIKYKSNWQNGALKAQRRNKWVCALRLAMSELEIFGPAGAGDPAPAPPGPVEYVQVPYSEYEQLKKEQAMVPTDEKATKTEVLQSGVDSGLADRGAVEQEEAGDFYHGAKSTGFRQASGFM